MLPKSQSALAAALLNELGAVQSYTPNCPERLRQWLEDSPLIGITECDWTPCPVQDSHEYSLLPVAGPQTQGQIVLLRERQENAEQRFEQAQRHLVQTEKMAGIGQLAAGVAHEINNPIGFVGSNLTQLTKYVSDLLSLLETSSELEAELGRDHPLVQRLAALKQSIDFDFLQEDISTLVRESLDGIERVKQIVQALKDFSRQDEGTFVIADLHRGINSTLTVVNNEIKYKATVEREFGEIPLIECMPNRLNQVIMNLVINASHAIANQGTITIRTGCEDFGVFIEIEDTGSGIAPENLTRIFEPFFTTKPAGIGTGLGLAVSYGIVEAHHGRLSVRSELGKGTCFKIWLPERQPTETESGHD